MKRRSFLLASVASIATLAAKTSIAQSWHSYTIDANSLGAEVPATMFGANLLAPHDGNQANGVANSTYGARIAQAGISGILRWPGGSLTEGDKYGNGAWIPGTGIDLTVHLNNPQWRTSLDQLLAYCNSNPDISPVIVLPTIRYLNQNRVVLFGQLRQQIRDFVKHIVDRTTTGAYPNAKVAIWEVGNEFDARTPETLNPSLTPREYAIIAEEIMYIVRRDVPPGYGSLVAVQGAPLVHSEFEDIVEDLQGRFRYRLQQRYGSDWANHLPDLLVYHAYPRNEEGADFQSTRMEIIHQYWGNIPLFLSEWNANNNPFVNGDPNPDFQWGMERAFMQIDLFRAMLENGTQHATFWPVQGGPSVYTAMYRYEGSSGGRYISGAVFNWLTSTEGLRLAEIIYSGPGSAIRVFGFCDTERRKAVAYICGRNAVSQTVKLIFSGMQGTIQSHKVERMFGPWGSLAMPTNPPLHGNASQEVLNSFRYWPAVNNVNANPSVVATGLEFDIPIRVSSTHPNFGTRQYAYEVVRVELEMTT